MTIGQILAIWSGNVDDLATGFKDGWSSDKTPIPTEEIATIVGQYFVVLLAGVVPFIAFWTRWLCAGSGRNYAENMVLHLYLIGQIFLFIAIAYIVQSFASTAMGSVLAIIILSAATVLCWKAATGFFAIPKWRAVLGSFLGIGGGTVTYIIAGSIVGAVVAYLLR